MKNLMARIKGFDYKGFFLQHGEKIGMGVAGLIVIAALATTSWTSEFKVPPAEMLSKAQTVQTQLAGNPWPESKKTEVALLSGEKMAERLMTPIDPSDWEYTQPMSPKVYTYRAAADEPVVIPPTNLIARPGQMAMALAPDPEDLLPSAEEEESEDEDLARPAPPAREKNSRKSNRETASGQLPVIPLGSGASSGPPGMAGMAGMMGSGMMGGGMMGGIGGSVNKARGARFVVVVGAVERRKQLELIQKALHLETVGAAVEYLKYADFKIERQRAVPGENPWTGNWVELDTNRNFEMLSTEALDFDPADVIETRHINEHLTSPLVMRLDGDWTYDLVGHPAFKALDAESREMEDLTTRAAAMVLAEKAAKGEDDEEAVEEEGEEERTGFGRVQRDANSLRQRAAGVDGSNQGTSRMAELMQGMMGQGGLMPGTGSGSGGMPPGMGDQRKMMESMSGMMGGGGAGMGGLSRASTGPISLGASLLLFRYFDFEVEPGECYRYRVQIVIKNPSEGEAFVSSPDVAVGRLRNSPWSEPSSASVVPPDVEYALMKVYRRNGRREGAELSVVQFDTEVGSLISSTLKLPYGSYVAQKAKGPHLNLAEQTFEEEEIHFTSQDLVVDSVTSPPLSAAVGADLKIDAKRLQKLIDGGLDQAVTLNRFGELVPLNADSIAELKPAKDRYEQQSKEYADLKESMKPAGGGVGSLDTEQYGDNGGKDGKKGRKQRGPSGLKVGGGMMGGGMPGMMGGGIPGMMGGGGMMPSSSGAPGMDAGGKKGGKKR